MVIRSVRAIRVNHDGERHREERSKHNGEEHAQEHEEPVEPIEDEHSAIIADPIVATTARAGLAKAVDAINACVVCVGVRVE
jgi:hypothetical protein